MNTVMVRYMVKEENVEQNIKFIEAVFEKLSSERPKGLRYASMQQDDGVSFVHLASIETEDGSNPLAALDAFKAFTRDIEARCDEAPAVTKVSVVGAYRVFD